MPKRKIFIVVGTRPNFMKAAPLLKEFKKSSRFNAVLVHTGQHYEFDMSKSFFDNLGLPRPHINLGVGSGTHVEEVGRLMIDTLMYFVRKAEESSLLEKLSLKNDRKVAKYAVLTLHRPSNVDNPETFRNIFSGLNVLSTIIPIIFPAHPRTRKKINNLDEIRQKIYVTSPLGYLDFLSLMSNATIVLTDSGGIQEETTVLGIPCLTIRSNTERPITVREGTNILVGNDPEKILNTAIQVLEKGITRKRIPKYWDGKAAERITKILISSF